MKKKCKYYPCHFEGQDCRFCYCPIYPCEDERFGKWYKSVWDCSKCTIFHEPIFASRLSTVLNYYKDVELRSKDEDNSISSSDM